MAGLHPCWMYPLLTLMGEVIGTYGTLIGAGGGILLVPTLLGGDLRTLHSPRHPWSSTRLVEWFTHEGT
jgi:hypothetical protein